MDDECEKNFQELKKQLVSTSILTFHEDQGVW